VVDDERALAELTVSILELEGFEARLAHSAEEALGMVRQWLPQTVLLDIVLPRMNGVVAALRLAREFALPDCRRKAKWTPDMRRPCCARRRAPRQTEPDAPPQAGLAPAPTTAGVVKSIRSDCFGRHPPVPNYGPLTTVRGQRLSPVFP
jgi:hypothetical protein